MPTLAQPATVSPTPPDAGSVGLDQLAGFAAALAAATARLADEAGGNVQLRGALLGATIGFANARKHLDAAGLLDFLRRGVPGATAPDKPAPAERAGLPAAARAETGNVIDLAAERARRGLVPEARP